MKYPLITGLCTIFLGLAGCQSQTQTGSADVDIPLMPTASEFSIELGNDSRQVSYTGKATELDNGNIAALPLTGGDGVKLTFKDNWMVELSVHSEPLSLADISEQGALVMSLNPIQVSQAALNVRVACEQNCRHSYRLREWAMAHEGQGWQTVAIPLSCLTDFEGASAVTTPFVLNAGGQGEIELKNVHFTANPVDTLDCPKRQSVTPSTLNEYWSVNWWMPRHQEKLTQATNSKADIVLIGDSITHGWENGGKAVWEKHFGGIPTLNLGFSGDRTENVLWRLNHNELQNQNADLTLIMIGTNNTGHRMDRPDAIRDGVAAIIDKVKQAMPDTHIVLQAIFPRGADNADAMRQNNQQTNQLLMALAEQENVEFININKAFLEPDGVLSKDIMPDLLHPNAVGYEIWAQQLTPYIDKYVGHN